MADVTPEQARAYLRRWALVREVETTELRRTPIGTKFRQLAALMESRRLFGPEPDRETQTRKVRETWALIRQTLGE